MKILVTGKQGQLARALDQAGAAAGIEVRLAGRAECDICDVASVDEWIASQTPDIVVNTAAYTSVDLAEREPDAAFAANAAGAENVARACDNAGIPLIHISTDYVFDGRKTSPYREADQTGPLNVYGRSKFEGERRVAQACARHIILRTSWVHSPWGNNFVKTMLRLGATRETIDVIDDQFGCPTYAPHLADAILTIARAVANRSDAFGTYHVAGQSETSWYGFAVEIFRQAALHGTQSPTVRPIAAAQYPTAAQRPANSRLDCARLQNVFGITLPDWRTGIHDCLTHAESPPSLGVMERRA